MSELPLLVNTHLLRSPHKHSSSHMRNTLVVVATLAFLAVALAGFSRSTSLASQEHTCTATGVEPDEGVFRLLCQGGCPNQGDDCEIGDWDASGGASDPHYKNCECEGEINPCCTIRLCKPSQSGNANGFITTGNCSLSSCNNGFCSSHVSGSTTTAACVSPGS